MAKTKALPGVKVGPLDPDSTAEFGQVGRGNSARTLIRLHAQLHPPSLTQALARKLDPERTKGLIMEEVRGYLAGLTLENGDPIVPEGAEVEGAQVRGDRDRQQLLTFTYRVKPSGRTGKWYTDFDPASLPDSAELGDELVHAAERRERGLVGPAFDEEGTSSEILRRTVSGQRREIAALRAQIEGRGDPEEEVPETAPDARPDTRVVDDNERLARENEELKARNAQLEQFAGDKAAESLRPAGAGDGGAAAEDEPVAGYDDKNAKQVIELVKDDETSVETVQAILDYERGHADRRSVVTAAERALDRG